MTRRIALVLALLLVVAGCAVDDAGEATGTTELGDIELAAALTPFDSCDGLLDHLRAEALERVGPYGLEGQPVYAFTEGDVVAAEAGDDRAGSALPGEATSPTAPPTTVATSGTNTQEAFVDEADIVKVSPARLLIVDDATLRIIDLTGDEPVARGTVELPGWGHQILVVGDRVLALGGDLGAVPVDDLARSTYPAYGTAQATLTEIDVSDPDRPSIDHTLTLDGAYLSARLVGETARVVVSATNPAFPFVYPSNDSPEALAIAEEANRGLIEASTVEDWLPTATLDGEPAEVITCDSVQQPAEFSGFGFLSVLTVDLGEALGVPSSTSVLADGQTVYASAESLYVATSRPPEVTEPEPGAPVPGTVVVPPVEDYETALHRFDITDEGAAAYVASGAVPGHLLNQFSLSEHEGRLRVATTEEAPWTSSEQAAGRVAVLETQGEQLVEVGAVEDLGRAEQIYAVRFLGDTAYVVTFRQTDPLFVVDLSDPAAPELRGELEIPGYSAYLHPVEEGYLLGIGQDADATGMTRGLQASVFDVTDPEAPTRVDQVVFPGAYSGVEYDHHAFLHWPATGQAVLPLSDAEAIVLDVGPEGVDEAGRITVPGGQEVRRNVVVGDHLLTIGAHTLVTTDLATLQPLAQLQL